MVEHVSIFQLPGLTILQGWYKFTASTASLCGAQLTGKDILNRGLCSRDLCAVFTDRRVWLLPKFCFGPSPVGKGVSLARVLRVGTVTFNH